MEKRHSKRHKLAQKNVESRIVKNLGEVVVKMKTNGSSHKKGMQYKN